MNLRSVCLYLFSIFFFSFPALAGNFSGYISVNKGHIFATEDGSSKKFELIAYNEDAAIGLKKLKDRDFISGVGTKSDTSILVESIDFVGLRQLLGLWVSNNAWLNFRDFNSVNVYWQDQNTTQKVVYDYSIAPDPARNWKIFFASSNEVVIADLDLSAATAKINYYDNNGIIVKTIELTKLSNYR
jgi:hypothetical protein